ncbi:hypothetical protein [Actinoplanes sp. ATCC 53533]|uniref:hypothetical protein n=1 Tax=Actinoplanes sp. ATCC 53533 TaxID=1288362 RepID=UPI000F7B5B31|nr:hypothetical protein [Actinoplanes sp. ATCC 53533]
MQVVGPDGVEITITSVSGADFSSVEAIGEDARHRRFEIAVTCYDDDGEREFVSTTGEIDREILLWVIDYCGRVLKGSTPSSSE